MAGSTNDRWGGERERERTGENVKNVGELTSEEAQVGREGEKKKKKIKK